MSTLPHQAPDDSGKSSANYSEHTSWLALGDSYTIGEGVPPEMRWPTQLTQSLGFAPPEYLAKTGWTTVDLLNAIASADLAARYDWVSVMVGVNDQYDGLGEGMFREGLNQIIDIALEKVAETQCVVVLSIPDYSRAPSIPDQDAKRIAGEVARFNTIIQEVARTKRTAYCDITPLSQQAGGDATRFVEDGLHPSGEMYRRWSEEVVHQITPR